MTEYVAIRISKQCTECGELLSGDVDEHGQYLLRCKSFRCHNIEMGKITYQTDEIVEDLS